MFQIRPFRAGRAVAGGGRPPHGHVQRLGCMQRLHTVGQERQPKSLKRPQNFLSLTQGPVGRARVLSRSRRHSQSLPTGRGARGPADAMAKGGQKRKKNAGVGIDFKRAKHKVGRAVPKGSNDTAVAFRSHAISLPSQSVAEDRAGAPVSSHNLTLKVPRLRSSHALPSGNYSSLMAVPHRQMRKAAGHAHGMRCAEAISVA